MNFEFTRPEYLILLALVPLIIFLHFYMLKRKRVHALKFANFDAIARVRGVDILSKNIVVLVTTVLLVLLIILALSGLRIQATLYSSSFSYILAIDSSTSMEATDILPDRITAAKETATTFARSLPRGTRLGVISFSGNAFIEQTLTEDKGLIESAILDIPLSTIGGTDLEEAAVTSSNLLEGEEAKAVVLLSDGRINVGTIDNAIQYANNRDVVIHTIAIGTPEGGTTSYGLSKIDEDALKALAHNTGGQYFFAGSKEELQSSLNQIIELKFKKVSLDTTRYLLLATLVLFLVEYVLINTRFRVLP